MVNSRNLPVLAEEGDQTCVRYATAESDSLARSNSSNSRLACNVYTLGIITFG